MSWWKFFHAGLVAVGLCLLSGRDVVAHPWWFYVSSGAFGGVTVFVGLCGLVKAIEWDIRQQPKRMRNQMSEPRDWLEKWERRLIEYEARKHMFFVSDEEIGHLVRIARAELEEHGNLPPACDEECKRCEALRDAGLLREENPKP